MRERLTISEEPEETPSASRQEAPRFERKIVSSHLQGPDGECPDVSVAISEEDGQLRETNFWDLDKILLLAEPIHARAVNRIFPDYAKDEASRQELHEVYFAGFTLGNSFREWDRMWRIYGEGQTQYKDASLYEREFMGEDNPNQQLIDEPGHQEGYHERANEILQRYGKIAYQIMKEEYEKDPEGFQKSFIKPEMAQLLKEKTRLGQVSVFMTANQKDFAQGLVAFSGLYKYGLALATDETMAGGGKEVAIRKLIEELESMGLKVNKERATAIGDSIKGDVGSGTKEGLASGVFVAGTTHDIQEILSRAKQEGADGQQVRSVLDGSRVEAIPTEEVRKSRFGIYRFGKRSSDSK